MANLRDSIGKKKLELYISKKKTNDSGKKESTKKEGK